MPELALHPTIGKDVRNGTAGLITAMIEIVFGVQKNPNASGELIEALRAYDAQQGEGLEGTLYLGYPLLPSASEQRMVDALLTTKQHGIGYFRFEL
jgi:hypothetical protein